MYQIAVLLLHHRTVHQTKKARCRLDAWLAPQGKMVQASTAQPTYAQHSLGVLTIAFRALAKRKHSFPNMNAGGIKETRVASDVHGIDAAARRGFTSFSK